MTKPDFLKKYFDGSSERPDFQEIGELFRYGVLYESTNSLLNGIINPCIKYNSIISAWVLGSSKNPDDTPYADDSEETTPCYMEPAGSKNWVSLHCDFTKQDIYNLLIKPNRLYHTKLDVFKDDVVILIKGGEKRMGDGTVSTLYWFLWYDIGAVCCNVGRFITGDTIEVVKTSFDEWANGLPHMLHKPWPLPNHFFKGWVSF